MADNQVLVIETSQGEALSKLQKQFNTYIRKIEILKKDIVNTRQQLDVIHKRVQTELVPLERKFIEKQAELVRLYDRHHQAEPPFTKAERKKIAHLLIQQAFDLIANYGQEDLKPIYDKYNGQAFDEEIAEYNAQTAQALKGMFETVFGMEFEEEADLSTPEAFQEQVQAKLAAEQQAAHEKKNSRKKTAAQLAKAERLKQEEKNISQASRKVYMELVKAFHPDLEPDEAERERKTEVMKQVTAAYENNDLFELLRLQLEFLQIDKNHINKLADEKLKYFNKILKEQVRDLQDEMDALLGFEEENRLGGGNPYLRFLHPPKEMEAAFKRETRKLKGVIKSLTEEIKVFSDRAVFKKFLAEYRISN